MSTERVEAKLDVCLEMLSEARAERTYLRAKFDDLEREVQAQRRDFSRRIDDHLVEDQRAHARVTLLELWRAKTEGVRIGVVGMSSLIGSVVGTLAAWFFAR